MIFKPGDKVSVVVGCDTWLSMSITHGKTEYEVESARGSDPAYFCCTGHRQHLTMTDGTQASGQWFDPDLVGVKIEACTKHGGAL